jgi:predicted lipoprotein with Yx(FWY)xxD motif
MRKAMVTSVALAGAVSVVALGSGGVGGAPASAATGGSKVQLHSGKPGRYVADGRGRTLYLFEKDRRGMSSCYGACAVVWAPYLTHGRPTAGKGINAGKLGVTRRRGGTSQVTYGGHPLYYYDDDHRAGQTFGQGVVEFGAKWFVVSAAGREIR